MPTDADVRQALADWKASFDLPDEEEAYEDAVAELEGEQYGRLQGGIAALEMLLPEPGEEVWVTFAVRVAQRREGAGVPSPAEVATLIGEVARHCLVSAPESTGITEIRCALTERR
jgi:hypothetical protein